MRSGGASLVNMSRVRPRFRAVTTVMIWSIAAMIPAQALAIGPEATAEAAAPAGPEAPAVAPAEPAPSPEVPAPAEIPAAPAEAVEPTAPEATPIAADMLDAQPETTAPATTPAPTTVSGPSPAAEEELTPNEAITKAYAPKFRPKNNPGKLNIAARLMFANAGAEGAGGGRFGGAAVDVGQSWNRFGYALTGTAYGGRFSVAETGPTEINALLGVGPTVGLGRMALLGRGFLDLRVGYDFYYGVVNERGGGTVLRPQSEGDVAISKARNLAPHGPRVRLDLGLVALDDNRRYFHGIGLSMGYQALVGTFVGEMPVTHMLTLGLSYWMG
jgi:hypothetical protein